MERSFGRFGANNTSSDGHSALARLGQRTGIGSLSLLHEPQPAMSVRYTVSEDRCGTEEQVRASILARLGNSRKEAENYHDHESSNPHPKLVVVTDRNGTIERRAEIARHVRQQPARKITPCFLCNGSFHGEHELRRHIDWKHTTIRKVWICKEADTSKPILQNCKACRNKKTYGANYNAAAHLRLAHFGPLRRKRDGWCKGIKGRGGIIGGRYPLMDELMHYMYEEEVAEINNGRVVLGPTAQMGETKSAGIEPTDDEMLVGHDQYNSSARPEESPKKLRRSPSGREVLTRGDGIKASKDLESISRIRALRLATDSAENIEDEHSSRQLSRLGRLSGRHTLNSAQHDVQKHSTSVSPVHYTISEDRCGPPGSINQAILARLGERQAHKPLPIMLKGSGWDEGSELTGTRDGEEVSAFQPGGGLLSSQYEIAIERNVWDRLLTHPESYVMSDAEFC